MFVECYPSLPNPHSPIPNPQSPIPNPPHSPILNPHPSYGILGLAVRGGGALAWRREQDTPLWSRLQKGSLEITPAAVRRRPNASSSPTTTPPREACSSSCCVVRATTL